MQDFYDIGEVAPEQIEELLKLAGRLQRQPEPRALDGKVLALLFLSPSLRTLASFQAAMTRLGGGAFVISPDMSIHGLETRPGIVMDGEAAEHIREAVPVIASYGDAIGIRAFAQGRNLENDLGDHEYREMRKLIKTPLINMESAIQHPCQSLADWKTMDDLKVPRQGGRFVLSWAYHPRALPLAVPASALQMAAMRGMDVTVLRPPGFELPQSLMARAKQSAEAAGGSLTRNRRSCASAGRRAHYLRQVLVIDPSLWRQARRRGSAAAIAWTGVSTTPGSKPPRPTAASCIACRCAGA